MEMPIGDDETDRIIEAGVQLQARSPRGSDGDELVWVLDRIEEIRRVMEPRPVLAVLISATARLREQLTLLLTTQAERAMTNSTSDSWMIDGTLIQLDHETIHGHPHVRGQRFAVALVLDRGIRFGPFDGIAFPGPVPADILETRWVLEMVDGVDPELAERVSRHLR